MADNTYIPKYFELYELLPPELYVGDLYTSEIARQRAFASYFDIKLLITIDKVRDIIGKPLICNTWFQDGNRRYCGFRTENCSVGARLSAHKEGTLYFIHSHIITSPFLLILSDSWQGIGFT